MSERIQSVCILTKDGKTSLLHAGDYASCVAAMREAGESFKFIGEGMAQVLDRDGRAKHDDGAGADYNRRRAAKKAGDTGKAESPINSKKAAKKAPAKKAATKAARNHS